MKTVFLELFSVASAPHFFAENGVVSKLARRGDLRLVLLIPDVSEFHAMARPYLFKHVRVETIKKTIPDTIFQKAFHFFYSYLIFTGTTKMLATFGARADAPPAGGNRHLAFVKASVAGTFGRSIFVKTVLVPWIYRRIFRKRPYKMLFDKYRPDLVCVTNIAFNPALELISESKRRGIKTIGYAANWDHLNKYYIPMHADVLLTQNMPMRAEAVSYHGYPPEAVRVIGFPQFDDFASRKFPRAKADFLADFGLPPESTVILYISGSVYAPDEPAILEEIAGWIESGAFGEHAVLMVRPYTGAREREIEEKKYRRLFGQKRVIFNWRTEDDAIKNKRNYVSMFSNADVIISVFSTTAIEAAAFDKPTITIGFDGRAARPYHQSVRRLEELSHFRHVLDTGSVFVARSFISLKQKISDYIRDPSLDKDNRRQLVQKMCYKLDGKAADRFADIASDYALNRAS